jgi:hypothetical protein
MKKRPIFPMNFTDEALKLLENNISPYEFLQKYKLNEEVIFKNNSGIDFIYKYSGSRYFTILAKREGHVYTPIFYVNSDMY